MINYGLVGKTYVGVFPVSLNVWSGTPVSFLTSSGNLMPVKTPRIPHVGAIRHPTLFLSPLDTGELNYKIVEVTSKFGQVQAMKVRLYQRSTGLLVEEKTSLANGIVQFSKLCPTESYTLVALDDEGVYNADVLDLKRPLV